MLYSELAIRLYYSWLFATELRQTKCNTIINPLIISTNYDTKRVQKSFTRDPPQIGIFLRLDWYFISEYK